MSKAEREQKVNNTMLRLIKSKSIESNNRFAFITFYEASMFDSVSVYEHGLGTTQLAIIMRRQLPFEAENTRMLL